MFMKEQTRIIVFSTLGRGLVLLLWMSLWTINSFAHQQDKPANPVSGIDDLSSPIHGGYGYLGRSSEAEAQTDVELDCSPSQKKTYLDQCTKANVEVTQKQNFAQIIQSLEENKATASLRNQIYEYWMLQAAATTATRPIPLSRPTCVDPPSFNYQKDLSETALDPLALSVLQGQMDRSQNPAQKEKIRKQLDAEYKLMAARNAMDADNVVNAIALFRQLIHVKDLYDCKPDGQQSIECLDLSDQINRIKSAYPIVFMQESPFGAAQEVERSAQLILGISRVSPQQKTNFNELHSIGTEFWNALVQTSEWNGMKDFKEDYLDAKYAAQNGFEELDSQGELTGKRLKNSSGVLALNHLEKTLQKLKGDLNGQIQSKLNGICDLHFSELSSQYPQVLRQLLLDQPVKNLPGIKYTICNTPSMENKLTTAKKRTCQGVIGKIDSGSKTVKVDRSLPTFPFHSRQKYDVKKNADGSLTVQLKINFQQRGQPKLSPEEFAKRMESIQQKASVFYNNSVARFKPKPNPAVKFEVSVVQGGDDPLFQFSKCYNGGLIGEDRYNCKSVGDSGGDWEDSANLTHQSSDNTIHHEFSHILGLEDEYLDDYYPMNYLGEHDSVMNNGHRLYPRHVRSILDLALRCGK
jgi:hypothetical protein